LDIRKLDDAKYLLDNPPVTKTLDYYKYLVKYYFLIDNLDALSKIIKNEQNIFVKSYVEALIYSAKGVYYFDDALKMFYVALKNKELYKEPLNELYYNISVIEIQKEDYSKSMNNIEEALKIEENEKYIVLKSYILMKQGKYIETQKLLNDSFDKIEEEKNLIKALNIINFTFDALKPMPKEIKEAYTRWLTVAQSGKNLQTVISVAQEGMRDYPEYSEMYTLAGLASYLLDNKSEAVNYFNKAIEIDKDRPFNYIQMGVIYWNLKQYYKAEEFFLKALSMNKYLPTVYAYLSKLDDQSENIQGSIKYKKYQIKFDSNIDTQMELVSLYKKVNDFSKTKELLENIIKKYPDSKKPYKEMVTLYDALIDEEPNPDVKIFMRKKQLMYKELYEQKDEEESKRRLVTAEIENNGTEK
jgi:tetratricopeptide (TPR) repeat protein